MARAKRHYIPGQVWHLTHRCHKREFLLKLVKDKRRWLQWLFEAKQRYGLGILNFTVTSNHIHLLVYDEKGRDVIPSSIKLIAGRTGQEYNLRKKRSFLGRSIPRNGVALQYPRLLPLHIPWHGESGYIRNTTVPFRAHPYGDNNWNGFLSCQISQKMAG